MVPSHLDPLQIGSNFNTWLAVSISHSSSRLKTCKRIQVSQSWEAADDGGGVPGHWEIMGFAVQQQFWSKSNLEVVSASFYGQCFVCCCAPCSVTGSSPPGWLVLGAFKDGREENSWPGAQEP